MKVAFFLTDLTKKGGVERATINLLNGLFTEVDLSLICLWGDKSTAAFPLASEVHVHSLYIKNYRKEYLSIVIGLDKHIREQGIDILVTVETMALIFTLPRVFIPGRRHVKNVVWEHFNFLNDNGSRLRRFMRRVASYVCDMIITLTERDRDLWIRELNVRKDKIDYIYNVCLYQNNVNIDYDSKSKIAIAIGRYSPVKGFDRLINAWVLYERVFGINRGWELQIVGYGDEKIKLAEIIKESGSETIYLVDGLNSSIEEKYQKAAFVCMTSHFEGLPMTLIEAQCFGLPSIAFDIFSGPSEIINADSGILVKDNDINTYAASMNLLMKDDDLRVEMSMNAFLQSKRFNKIDICKLWAEKLKKLSVGKKEI